MAVTSTTVGGVNVWQFSGAVTDAEIKTAWSALIVNQEYVIGRAIYLDSTCDLNAVQGGFFVNINLAGVSFILHASRDKTKTVFRNWNFRQTAGISVTNRTISVQSWNGTALSLLSGSSSNDDGLSMFAGSFTYAVVGNPGGADPRYLDEFAFGTLDGGTLITSSAFTEQELQPDIRGARELKGVVFTRCFGFPQATGAFTRLVMWRSFQNSMHPTQRLVRAYGGANICYIDSTLRRNNAPVANPFIDTFGGAVTNLLVLNNWRDETWFGVSKTTFLAITGWNINSTLRGGILKRLQFVGAGANGTVKVYDSRSTTVPQRSTFVGTANADFLAATTGTQTDSEGKVQIVSIGAIMNSNLSVTRYTGQKFTYQQFGKRVMVTNLDVTAGGDNDLSAYAPIVLTNQEGILRTESAINSATSIDNFQQLLEELHVLAIGLSGEQSYSGAYDGNLFTFNNGVLTTSFTTVNVDATAVSKIAFDSVTNTLTIKSSVLTDNSVVTKWINSTGEIELLNSAIVTGTYEDITGTYSRLVVLGLSTGMAVKLMNGSTVLSQIVSSGSSVNIPYFIASGSSSISANLFVERATGQANGYNLYTNTLTLESSGTQTTTAIMSIDTFYGRSSGRPDRANVSVTWDSGTGAPTITLSGDADVKSVYDVVLESHATTANITYVRPTTADGFTYQFGNAIFTGTGKLTGSLQFFTTGAVSITYDLILNYLNVLNFLPNSWIKVIKTSDNSVLSPYALNTIGKLELNMGTGVDYKVFLKKDGYKPLVVNLNSGTGQTVNIAQIAQSYYNGLTDISTLIPKLDVINSGGILSIVSVGEMTATSQEVCAIIDYLQKDQDYADVALFANNGDIWEIISQYQNTPDPTYIKITRDASLTNSQYTIWDTYFTSSSTSFPDTNITPVQTSTGLWVISNRSAVGEVTIKNEQAVSISQTASEYVWSKILENGKTANKNVAQSNNFDAITSIEVQKTN